MNGNRRRLEAGQDQFQLAAIDDSAHLPQWRAADARIERVVRIDVAAWDLNCRQHFPKLVSERSVRRLADDYETRLAELQARGGAGP